MADENGASVPAAYNVVRLLVRVTAPGVSCERLRALVEHANQRSPVSSALQHGLPVKLSIDLQD